jgi:hypothetical protein
MYKTTVKFKNFDGNVVEQAFYFNLTKVELTRITAKYGVDGSLEEGFDRIAASGDNSAMLGLIEDIVLTAVGQRLPNGQFMKSPEFRSTFEVGPAYAELFERLFTDKEAMATFIKNVPADSSAGDQAPIMQVAKSEAEQLLK